MDQKHPEGLPFAPEGDGWTRKAKPPTFVQRGMLLNERNINALKFHHETEWNELETELDKASPPPRFDAAVGRIVHGLSEEERQRLLALTLLVRKGGVREEILQ